MAILLKGNDVQKEKVSHSLRYFTEYSDICETVLNIMTKCVSPGKGAATWMFSYDIYGQIDRMAEYHIDAFTVETACMNLKTVLKYSGRYENTDETENPGDVRCSKNPLNEDIRNPWKARHRTERESTRVSPKLRRTYSVNGIPFHDLYQTAVNTLHEEAHASTSDRSIKQQRTARFLSEFCTADVEI